MRRIRRAPAFFLSLVAVGGTLVTVTSVATQGPAAAGTSVPVYDCSIPFFGGHTASAVVSESPDPPASLQAAQNDLSDGFTTTPEVDFVADTALVNFLINSFGATAITFDTASLTIGQNGGAAFTQDSQVATQANVQTFPISLNTPLNVQMPFTPLSWTTGLGTGYVQFTPGELDITANAVVGTTALPPILTTCSPESPVPPLDATTVSGGSVASVSFPEEVSPSGPNVTPDSTSEAAWSIPIANTSAVTLPKGTSVDVTGSYQVGSDPPVPVTFDTTAMKSSSPGENCPTVGTGEVICSFGAVQGGAVYNFTVVVPAAGLPPGAVISASATVSSPTCSEALCGSVILDPVTVIVFTTAGDAIVTAPAGKKVSNTSAPVGADNPVVMTVKTSRKVLRTGLARPAGAAGKSVTQTGLPATLTFTVCTNGESADATGACTVPTKLCSGAFVCSPAEQVTGQVSGRTLATYKNTSPVTVKLVFFVGTLPSTLGIWMQKDDAFSTVVPVTTICKQTSGSWNTPCLVGKVAGSASKGTITATVKFSGGDPVFRG